MLSDKLSKLLLGDDIKAIQKIVISIGHICVKETSSTELDMALNLIFSLCRSKVIQLLPHLLYDLLISSVTHVGLMFTLMFFCVLSPVSIFCLSLFCFPLWLSPFLCNFRSFFKVDSSAAFSSLENYVFVFDVPHIV